MASYNVSTADGLVLIEVMATRMVFAPVSGSDSLAVTDAASQGNAPLSGIASDTLALTDAVSFGATTVAAASDGLILIEIALGVISTNFFTAAYDTIVIRDACDLVGEWRPIPPPAMPAWRPL